MASSEPKRHPTWVIALTIGLCVLGAAATVAALVKSDFVAAGVFFALTVVASLVPRIRQFVLSFNAQQQTGTLAVKADSGTFEDPKGDEQDSGQISQESARRDDGH